MNLLDSALKFLSYRPRSKKEVEIFLRKKTSDASLIDQTISKLENLKLINDEEFAKWLIESRSRSRPRGKRLLIQELKQKGLEFRNSDLEFDEASLAKKALEKKKPKTRDQAIRFLQYRGFGWDAIARVVKEEYNETHVK